MVIEIDGGGGGGGGGSATVYERGDGGVTNGTDAENLSFSHRGSWSETLPEDYGPAANKLLRYRYQFDKDDLTSNSGRFDVFNQSGTGLLVTNGTGEATFTANAEFCSESYNTGHHPPVPFYSSMIRVENIDLDGGTIGTAGNAADVFLGVVNSDDSDAMITGGYNASVDRFETFTRDVAGNTNANSLGGSLSDYGSSGDIRFDMLVTLAGDECWLAVRDLTVDNPAWDVVGSATFGSNVADFYDQDVWGTDGGNWTNCFRFAIGDSRNVTVSDYEVFHGMGLGVRDPHPITYKDGAPIIEDGRLWFTGTAGSGQARGYLLVMSLGLEEMDVQLHGQLYANAEDSGGTFDDYVSNYVAPHVFYNEDLDRFTVLWSAFGNGANDPRDTFTDRPVFVTHTDRDIRHGVHHLKCSPANLPAGVTGNEGGKHDAFVAWDAKTGYWWSIYNSDLVDEITIARTRDDDLQSGWDARSTVQEPTDDIEGGCLARVNGELVAAYGHGTTLTWVNSDGTKPDFNDTTAFTLDRNPGDPDAPWATATPIPWDDDTTKYLLISMDQSDRGGFGNSAGGSYMFYLSDEQADGYEYPHRKLARPW